MKENSKGTSELAARWAPADEVLKAGLTHSGAGLGCERAPADGFLGVRVVQVSRRLESPVDEV